MKKFLRRNRVALFFTLIYFVPAILWVLFSDSIFDEVHASSAIEKLRKEDMIKDASFVLAVAVMLFFIIRLSRIKLKKTRKQYENLFEQHPLPMWIYELQTLRFIAVNDAAIHQYGYSREEFLKLNLKDIRPFEEIPALEQYLNDYRQGQNNFSLWKHVKKNGETIIVEVAANDATFFRKPCRVVCATDVTDRIRREGDIRRLSLVAENATNSVIICDNEAHIEWVNKAFTKQTGYGLGEVRGKKPREFLHGPDTDLNVLAEINKAMAAGRAFSGEILNYRKDGSRFWLKLTISPVLAGGKVANYVTVQTDITAIKEQNEKLRDIAYTASHGFRKPLANILGLISLIQDGHNEQEVVSALKESSEELDREARVIVDKASKLE
jgi:PAS domain S-box-containing protein